MEGTNCVWLCITYWSLSSQVAITQALEIGLFLRNSFHLSASWRRWRRENAQSVYRTRTMVRILLGLQIFYSLWFAPIIILLSSRTWSILKSLVLSDDPRAFVYNVCHSWKNLLLSDSVVIIIGKQILV